MEIYFSATGEQRALRLFEERLNTIPVILPGTLKNGAKVEQPIYSMLQEIKIYRLVFPRAYKDDMLKTLGLPHKKEIDHYKKFNTQAYIMRKALNADKIPEPVGGEAFFINTHNVGIKGIGIKEDVDVTFPNGCTNEGI